jgi:hypothetical protein
MTAAHTKHTLPKSMTITADAQAHNSRHTEAEWCSLCTKMSISTGAMASATLFIAAIRAFTPASAPRTSITVEVMGLPVRKPETASTTCTPCVLSAADCKPSRASAHDIFTITGNTAHTAPLCNSVPGLRIHASANTQKLPALGDLSDIPSM